jgi:hypothetical protein
MASSIGLKIANGEFHSIMEGNSAVKKRLILTTVHDNQRSVQIDLYKSDAASMADALYIGSLVVENISPKPKGEPSIEMKITSTTEGEITADAVDLGGPSGEEQHLSVSLRSFDEDNREYDIPDFEVEVQGAAPQGLYEKVRERGDIPWRLIIISGSILILLCLGLWFFLVRNKAGSGAEAQGAVGTPATTGNASGEAAREPPAAVQQPPEQKPALPPAQEPPAAVQQPPEQKPAPPVPEPPAMVQQPPKQKPKPPEVPGIQAPPQQAASPFSNRLRPDAPVYSFKELPQTIPKEGFPYTIRWGDTLWDISEAFYRNGRLFPHIARHNKIPDADLITSGTILTIPPRR